MRYTLLLFVLPITLVRSVSVLELFGLGDKLVNLTSTYPTADFEYSTPQFVANPQIQTYLQAFKTRLRFCQFKCKSIYNLPCFMLFQCNIHIRNFFILFFFPIFFLGLTGLCCGKGIWTFACWMKYIARFSCVQYIVAGLTRFKLFVTQKINQKIHKNVGQNNMEKIDKQSKFKDYQKIQPPQSTQRNKIKQHKKRRSEHKENGQNKSNRKHTPSKKPHKSKGKHKQKTQNKIDTQNKQ